MAFNEFITPITNGNYCVRLVKNDAELKQYKDLRYKHLILAFDPEKDPNGTDTNLGYDNDTSQLCVFYKNPETDLEEVVGGYILMRFKKEDAFCKATLKYDLTRLFSKHKYEVLELTRATTHPGHRNGIVINLMWEGVKEYAKKYNLRFVIGTMSFLGLDPLKYSQAASYLYRNYLMAEDIMAYPVDSVYFHEILPEEKIDRKTAIAQIPPLLKGFLRQGAKVGTGFYVDHDLKTVETLAIIDLQQRIERSLK